MENSRLNNLPAELRIRVYEFALTIPDGVPLYITHHEQNEPVGLGVQTEDARERLQLLSTCKQIRYEALPVFFSRNYFSIATGMLADFHEDESDFRKEEALKATKAWLASISPWLQYIRYLAIDSEQWHPHDAGDDYVVSWLPRALNEFRAIIANPRTQVALSLRTLWSSINTTQSAARNRMDIFIVHGDPKRARASFDLACRDPAGMVAQLLQPADSNADHESQQRRHDLQRSRDMIDRLLREFEKSAPP